MSTRPYARICLDHTSRTYTSRTFGESFTLNVSPSSVRTYALMKRKRSRSAKAPMTDKHAALEAITASLREVVSIRDFLAAVEVGAQVAHTMLDNVEGKLLEILNAIDRDGERQ
jgi:hypothetical protein